MTHPSMDSSQFFFAGEAHFLPENRHFDQKPLENNNHFTIEDLLDFPKDDELMTDAFFDNVAGNSTDSSTVTGNSCNSSVSGGETQVSGNISCRSFADAQLSGELCVPYEDLAELEWLSNFVEDSFSSDDLQNLQLITATTAPIDTSSSETVRPTTEFRSETGPVFPADVAVRGKARSKRSRAIPCTWASRLVVLAPPAISSQEPNATVSAKTTPSKKRDSGENPGRRCLHCASEKTPQWRTGPMGPKTLCNACGVRYKSGRLVPEYRPAASPTFVSAKHSNSHRKVLELRRQREVQMQQQQQFLSQSSIFGVSNGGDEYLIHHRHHQSGHDYHHMI